VSQPLRASLTISHRPPTGVASNGRLCMRATFGQHSHREGTTITSESRMKLPTSCCSTVRTSPIRGAPAHELLLALPVSPLPGR
jgi:hypothetical protein